MKKNQQEEVHIEECGDESFPASDPPSWTASGIGPIEQTEPVEEGSSDPQNMGKPSADGQHGSRGATCRTDKGFEEGSVDK